MPVERHHLVKVYDQDGTNQLKTFSTKRPEGQNTASLKAAPSFDSRINGGYGELVLDLALPIDDYDEGNSVDFMNVVKVYAIAVDDEEKTQTETLIYTGFVSKYEAYLEGEGGEGVRVTCLGLVSLLAFSFYKSGSSYEVIRTAEDPSVIGQAVITHFNTVFGGSLLSSSVESVGTAVSLTFTDQRHADALVKVHQVSGEGWWWKVDEAGVYHLRQKPSSPTHTFTVGKDVLRLVVPKDSEKVVNDVQVRGADSLTADASDAASQTAFGTGSPATGKRSVLVTDNTLADANGLSQRAAKEVADGKDEKVRASLVINRDYPIETVKVGQTCNVRNIRTGLVPDNSLIVSVRYDGDTITLELEEQGSNLGRELSSLMSSGSSSSSGSSGGGGSSGFVDRETPAGAINGSNTGFTLSQSPVAGSEHLYLDGVLQQSGGTDYTISGAAVTFVNPPPSGSILLASFRTSNGSNTFADREVPTGTIDGVNDTFTLANTPTAGSEHVYLNGILQTGAGGDYSISGDEITFNVPPPAGSVLLVSYRY